MSIRIVYLVLSLWGASTLLQAQNNLITISGTVKEKATDTAIEFATVQILSANDSIPITGGTTKNNGYFALQVPLGKKYITKVSFVGFENAYIDVSGTANTKLGTINLSENSTLLNEAVVEAKALEIVVKGDTIEYNADSYKVQETAVVEDLLKKMPGVEIDSEGTITINGKEVKRILVDGKEFFSDDPKVASKNLPAKMIEKLQILDKKSDLAMLTGFDDGNEETVINLQVKPGMKKGTFGNAFVGAGNHNKYEQNAFVAIARDNTTITLTGGTNNTNNAGASDLASTMFGNSGGGRRGMRFGGNNGVTKSILGAINITTTLPDKLKLSTDVRYMHNDNTVTSESSKTYTSEQNPGIETDTTNGRNKSNSVAANMRLEWTPDKITTIIFTPNVEYNNYDREQISKSSILYDSSSPLANKNNNSNQEYTSEGHGHKLSGNLDFSRKLNDKGRVVSLGVQGGVNNSKSDGYNWNEINYITLLNDSIIDQKFSEESNNYDWKINTSFVEPIRNNLFAELSYRISGKRQETDKETYTNSNLPNISIPPIYNEVDTANTRNVVNNFINQNISLKLRGMASTYNWMAGVAMEPSSSKTKMKEPNTPNFEVPRRNYLHFTPVAQFQYNPDKTTNLRIDYSGSTSEPTSLMLYDGVYSRNGLNTTSGNPNLKPSFTSNLNMRFRKSQPEKGSFMFANLRLEHVTNAIVNTSSTNANGGKDAGYTNVNGDIGTRGMIGFNIPLKNKNWSINSRSFITYNINNTLIENAKNRAKNLILFENIGAQFRSDILDFGIRANIRYNHISNSINTNNNSSVKTYGGTSDFIFYAGDLITKQTGGKLFKGINLESDITYSANSGYSAGYKQNEWLWNASLTKEIFSSGVGTGFIRLKIYDILKQRSNISNSYTATYTEFTRTNTLSRYFMVHFIYKFQIFGNGTKQSDMEEQMPRGGRGPGGGGRPPRM